MLNRVSPLLAHKRRKRRDRSLRSLDPAHFLPPSPSAGHKVVAVVIPGGSRWVRWEFDAPIADAGEACQGLKVNGLNPAGFSFTPGSVFVLCSYPAPAPVGSPWQYLGPAAEVTFQDGLPGEPSSGAVAAG